MVGDSIGERLRRVRAAIEASAQRAGRPQQVTLVAVTKTVPAERVREAYDAGQRVFGENRVQEGVAKIAALARQSPDAVWHLIGHLQTNKARQAAEVFSLVESVDSARLAERLNDQAGRAGRKLPVLLEVNVAGEASKHGFSIDGFRRDISTVSRFQHLELRGLMTVAPLTADPEEVRSVFRSLRALRDEVRATLPVPGFDELSMGMSGDFEVAIEEGATMVRIGRAIFGDRSV